MKPQEPEREPQPRHKSQHQHRPETRAVHAGAELNETTALSPPIFQTSTFELPSAAAGAQMSVAQGPAEFYTRWGNPTIKQCEHAIAALEGAEAALAFASGMGALSALFFTAVQSGDHVVLGRSIYSGVHELVTGLLRRYGVDSTLVEARDVTNIETALRTNTRLILVESPTNPTLELCDLAALGRLGKERGVLTAVDGTFATPANQQPLELGIDVVAHSATKGLGGHSDLTAGVLCGRREWIDQAWSILKLVGAALGPFEAWLLLRGLKTLFPRMRGQNETTLELARFLEDRPEVARVHYPGLPSHPQHELACRQMGGFGGLLAVELRDGYDAAVRFSDHVKVIRLAVSLGGAESLVQHPASMTHGMLPRDQIEKAGIVPGLLRISVGLEHVDDLKRDIEQALTDKS